MSTLHLSPEHLRSILWGCTQYQVLSKSTLPEELNALMMELFARNAEEYNENYPNDLIDPSLSRCKWIYQYTVPQNTQALTALALYKLCLCYQYNSSGSRSWKGSKAESLTNGLMTQAILSLPEYQSAEWDI